MRGAFNKTCTLVYGARSAYGPPGAPYASLVPCRVVDQDEIAQHQFPFNLSGDWITLDAFELNGPITVSPAIGVTYVDYLTADQVHVPGLGGVAYSVCRAERVSPFGAPAYWRYLLVPLVHFEIPPWLPLSPLPPLPAPEPGAVCAAAGLVAVGDLVSGVSSVTGEWWQFRAFASGPHRVTMTASEPNTLWYLQEKPCGYGASVDLFAMIGGCATTQPLVAGRDYVVRVYNASEPPDAYTWKVDLGECP